MHNEPLNLAHLDVSVCNCACAPHFEQQTMYYLYSECHLHREREGKTHMRTHTAAPSHFSQIT